jgi:hypothetical protein
MLNRDTAYFLAVFAFAALSFTYKHYALGKSDAYLLRAAMISTLMADFCMLILYENEAGLVFFCLTQTICHLRFKPKDLAAASLGTQIALCILVPIALKFLFGLPLRDLLASAYAVALLFSAASSVLHRSRYPSPNSVMVPAGMILFLLCDINVGLYNLPLSFRPVFQTLIWVFYLPSQLVLALSARSFKPAGKAR